MADKIIGMAIEKMFLYDWDEELFNINTIGT